MSKFPFQYIIQLKTLIIPKFDYFFVLNYQYKCGTIGITKDAAISIKYSLQLDCELKFEYSIFELVADNHEYFDNNVMLSEPLHTSNLSKKKDIDHLSSLVESQRFKGCHHYHNSHHQPP